MSKKILSIFLAIIMVLSIAPMYVFADEDITSYLTYEINNGEVTITSCDTSISGDVVIPDTIEGYPVTTIGYWAFSGLIYLTEIEIPSSVEYIEDGAFYCCIALENITVASENQHYTSKDGVLFNKDMTTLLHHPENNSRTEYSVPDSVTAIGMGAFGYNSNLEKINMSENITVIGHAAFICSMSLKEIDLPSGLTAYGESIFGCCYSLENVVIPENIQNLNAGDYLDCFSLKSVTIYNKDIEIEEYAIGFDSQGFTIDRAEYAALHKEMVLASWRDDIEKHQEISEQLSSVTIQYDVPQPIDGFTIYGYEGSPAETYANENGINFVALCEHNYIADTVITPATYSQTGISGTVCEFCGDVLDTYEVPMLTIEDSEEVKNEDNDVSIIYPEDSFDGTPEIEVKPVTDGEKYKLVVETEGFHKATVYDIDITVNGEKVQPNGSILVKVPVPNGYRHERCIVVYVADDGHIEEVRSFYKDGYIYFETNHFSCYAVVEDEEIDECDWLTKILNYFEIIKEFIDRIINAFKALFNM